MEAKSQREKGPICTLQALMRYGIPLKTRIIETVRYAVGLASLSKVKNLLFYCLGMGKGTVFYLLCFLPPLRRR